MNPLARRIIETAQRAADPWWRAAVATRLEGGTDNSDFVRVANILARAWLLATLVAEAETASRAARGGADLRAEPIGDAPQTFAKRKGSNWTVAVTASPDSFVVEPFWEAIASFERKVPRLKTRIRPLLAEARRRGIEVANGWGTEALERLAEQSTAVQAALRDNFWVAHLGEQQIVDVRKSLAAVIRGEAVKSVPLPEWIEAQQAGAARSLTSAHLETVFRTNLSAAYAEGTVRIAKDPAIRAAVPLYRLEAVGDNRTRGKPDGLYPEPGRHYQMDGFVGTIEQFEALGIVPPNGYNCRCTIVPVPAIEAEDRGWLDASGRLKQERLDRLNAPKMALIKAGRYPDPSFAR